MRRFGIVAVATMLGACSIGADVPTVKNAVAAFHRQLDAGKFAETYANAAPELHGVATEKEWVQVLDAVHRKLGKFQSAAEPGWNDQMNTGGHFITLAYRSKYERGDADEQFVYKIVDGKALIVGYHVNSNALIAN